MSSLHASMLINSTMIILYKNLSTLLTTSGIWHKKYYKGAIFVMEIVHITDIYFFLITSKKSVATRTYFFFFFNGKVIKLCGQYNTLKIFFCLF